MEPVVSGEMFEEKAPRRRQGIQPNQNQPYFPMPKLHLPLFKGQHPRWWIKRCEKLFFLYQVPKQQNITSTFTYLNDVADSWFQGWIRLQNNDNWTDFTEDFCAKFGDRNLIHVVEEFNKLRQESARRPPCKGS